MTDVFSVIRDPELSSRTALESAAFSPEKREEEVAEPPSQAPRGRKLCGLHLSAGLAATPTSVLTWKTPAQRSPQAAVHGVTGVGHA